jgi:hypothetical protein
MNKCRLLGGLFLWTVFSGTGEGQTLVDLRTQSKSVDFSGAGSTKPMQTGSSLPSTCAVGQFFFLTTAAAGSNVYGCNPVNTWTVEGSTLSVNAGTLNEVLSNNGSSIQWLALGGDISGTPTGLTVNRLQGRSLSNTTPSGGQVLQWNATANQWQPAPAEAGNASYSFASQLTVTIPGTVHQFGTANLVVDCFDNSTPPQRVEPDKTQISPTTYNVTITFSTAQTGYCVVNGAGTASAPGSAGAVTSAFGRGGAIMAQTGDYNFGQISGSVNANQLPPAGGDVSGTLTTATVSGIQNRAVANTTPDNGQTLVWNSSAAAWQPGMVSQIMGTVTSGQLPVAGGDVAGSLTNATVKGIQNRVVANTAPTNGQALVWNSSAAAWQPSIVSGSGATMAYQLGDLVATRTSSTVLTIGAGCAPTSPCNVRFGYQLYSITNSATATLSGSGTGTAYIYVNTSGILTVGNNLTVTCSAGCTQQSGITAFPPNVLPVYTWTASNGTWNNPGGTDQRAFLSAKTLANGIGIILTESPAQSYLAVDNSVIPTYLMNSATLNFPSIAAGACAVDQTLTVAGANLGDAVAPGWPALPAGVLGAMLVSSTNTITVRLCNMSASSVTPPSSTYRATVVRNY